MMASMALDAQTSESQVLDRKSAARSTTTITLFAITLLALLLRTVGIQTTGFVNSDEAAYARHGRFFHEIALPSRSAVTVKLTTHDDVERVKRIAAGLVNAWNARNKDFYKKATYGHAWLTAGVMFVVGSVDYAPFLVSAIFGAATVVLVFLIASEVDGRVAGLMAATFLAVSRYAIFYSRTGLAESDSVFFLTLALWWYVRARGRGPVTRPAIAVTGFLFGLAPIIHYRWLAVFPVFLVLEALVRSGDRREKAMQVAVGLSAYAVPFVLAELPSHAMMMVANLAEVPLIGIPSYGMSLVRIYSTSQYAAFNLATLYVYPLYVLLNDGPVTFVAAITGAVMLAFGRTPADGILLRYLGVLFLFLLFQNVYVARSFSAGLPIVAVSAGIGLWRAMQMLIARGMRSLPVAASSMFVVISIGMVRAMPLIRCKSAIRQVAMFLEEQHAARTVFPSGELGQLAYKFYGGEFAVTEANTLDEFHHRLDEGADWVVVDAMPYLLSGKNLAEWQSIRTELRASGPPEFSAVHVDGCWSNWFCEVTYTDFAPMWHTWRTAGDRAPAPIEVYRVPRR